jgi:ABC-type multidrug transport system fused ATPase/permease subunit
MERLMREHRSDRTIIIVAHRTSTLKEADTILVLDRGQIIEQGNFRGLSEDPESQFGMMCAIQST